MSDSGILCINLNAFHFEFLFNFFFFLYSFGLMENKFIDLNQHHHLPWVANELNLWFEYVSDYIYIFNTLTFID